MSTRMAYMWLAAALAALLALPQPSANAAPAYSITPITGKYTRTVDMNNAGQVAVNNNAPEVPYHTGYISSFPMSISIPTPAGWDNTINGINNHADAVGSTFGPGGAYAFAYTNANGRLRDLSAAYGMHDPNAINDRGDIAGQIGERGALARAGGTLEVFGPESTRPVAINNEGEVVGGSVDPTYGNQAFIYAAHQFNRLGRLGGSYSSASAINDAGVVVGDSSIDSGAIHAFRYSDGVMEDLTPSAKSSVVGDINNEGQIVGTIDGRAFLFANGKITDLNTLIAPDSGWLLVSASDINDRHQILAFACDPTGVFCYSSVRLDPIPAVPEPGGAAMLLAGAGLLWGRGRWRFLA